MSERKDGCCKFCKSPYHRGWQCKLNPKIQDKIAKRQTKPPKAVNKPKTKKSSSSDRKKLVHKFDELFSKYIRKKAELEGRLYCFTCGKRLTYDTAVAMHFIGRRVVSTRFDEDNVKVGCRECNAININQPKVLEKYSELLGEDVVKRLNEQKTRKISTIELENLYKSYLLKYKKL